MIVIYSVVINLSYQIYDGSFGGQHQSAQCAAGEMITNRIRVSVRGKDDR